MVNSKKKVYVSVYIVSKRVILFAVKKMHGDLKSMFFSVCL